ncbi:MAG TPA: tetratricopeptide repeat protein [Candidatus Udaeobacter sp.]|nr:tetratricopeptide repeat protein [Candidatus Udaeobacter sp.]
MKLRGMAALTALVIGLLATTSFAADNVAPTKAELEEMYNAAYRAFDTNNFPEALKQLDAIDARQPDLAAAKNLRGVILMRQGDYDKAESALQEASRIDPKFWNARFNLAEIPFLKKDWAVARKRFEGLLSTGHSDLAKDASQLIQYKILLTYLMEGKSEKVDSILAKLEVSPDTPAVDYVKAAVALQQKNEKEAKDWMAVAEKNFTPQQNKLFAESLYEVGWLQKPAGEGRPSLPLMTAAERTEKTKAAARSKFEQGQQAFRQRDFAAALKLIDDADKADANQPATVNLRGEILMQQQKFDDAEAAFKKAAKLDPKLREAQYNLALVPFKKKEYAKARERFETLYKRTPGGDKNQAAELIKFKIYMTLLLEGKESRAHAMMEEFQFTGDTPALYYAQAAWEYKHNNAEKAQDWTNSANKIYSPALNGVFADAFYDAGWIQRPESPTTPALASDTTNAGAPQAEGVPAVEPSPIPDRVFAANQQPAAPPGDALTLGAAASSPNAGTEVPSADATTTQPAVSGSSEPTEAATSSQPEQAAASQSPATSESVSTQTAVAAETPQSAPAETAQTAAAVNDQTSQQAAAQPSTAPKSPLRSAVATASAKVLSAVSSGKRMWIVGGLLLAAAVLLAWVIVPVLRRNALAVPRHLRLEPPDSVTSTEPAVLKPTVAQAQPIAVPGNGFVGGPRQVSLQLKPWNSSLQHAALPARKKLGGAFNRLKERKVTTAPAPAHREPDRDFIPVGDTNLDSSVGPVLEQTSEPTQPPMSEPEEFLQPDEVLTASAETDGFAAASPIVPQTPTDILEVETPSDTLEVGEDAAFSTPPANDFFGDVKDNAWPSKQPSETFDSAGVPWPAVEASTDFTVETTKEEQPEEMIANAEQASMEEPTPEPLSELPIPVIVPEPVFPQITTPPVAMPETTQTPTVPVNKAPAPPVAKPQPHPQPAPGTMQTSVQLTFSFEIAAMQLTPSFKMGVLKVRPISKLVTMRLPSPQRAQTALNLQVAFEIVKIQPVAGALGTIRAVPSQQQRPSMAGMPSFAVAGLQVVPNSETAPVQLTPSQQGRASVFITVPFQISTLEFSPSLEIASVILNSNSKQVVVQLPGAGPGSAEGAPMFEIANLELNESGEITMMQLNLLGGPKRA